MKGLERMLDALVFGIARRASGRVIVALALAWYAAVGLALPIVLNASPAWLVALNVWGTLPPGTLLLAWLSVRITRTYRRHLVEWTTNLRNLTPSEFEWLVGELFRREGWTVEETGKPDAPDGNVDLRLRTNGREVLVQCKRWESRLVGIDHVRAFNGTLLKAGLAGTDGMFVSLSGFTAAAREEAAATNLTLVDGEELYARIERARRVEPCPICGAAMRLARSDYGWWFRCLAPGCSGKRDLGRDVGRAADYLTTGP